MLNTKRCPNCQETKASKHFNVRKDTKILEAYCKPCQKERRQAYYRLNSDYLRATAKIKRDKIRMFIKELKTKLSCIKCGFSHPAALQFHHRDPSQKKFTIGQFATKFDSKDILLAEIAKCDVLCANCHFILHY